MKRHKLVLTFCILFKVITFIDSFKLYRSQSRESFKDIFLEVNVSEKNHLEVPENELKF